LIKFIKKTQQYCADNAAMIAFVANDKAKQNKFDDLSLDIF
jgi:tRNA A37 threonylcarbamoyltransferase TsaD